MMIGRPTVVRRRPLLRAAAIGGTYAAGRAAGRRAEEAEDVANTEVGQGSVPTQPTQPTAGAGPAGGQESKADAPTPVLDQLSRLTAMHDQGALTDEEFAAAKAKVLGG
jgi:hypothetical protein